MRTSMMISKLKEIYKNFSDWWKMAQYSVPTTLDAGEFEEELDELEESEEPEELEKKQEEREPLDNGSEFAMGQFNERNKVHIFSIDTRIRLCDRVVFNPLIKVDFDINNTRLCKKCLKRYVDLE